VLLVLDQHLQIGTIVFNMQSVTATDNKNVEICVPPGISS
jgi:hypothetical protein